jgi:sphingolipid 4-desaturase/C4-monooxygenase
MRSDEQPTELDVFNGTNKLVKRQATPPASDFLWSREPEPHAIRKKHILAAHPEVKQLFGTEPLTPLYAAIPVAVQLATAYLLRDVALWSWQFWLTAYVVGGTATHAIFLAVHEVSHMLAFRTFWHNKAANLLINLPLVVPCCVAFRGYHLEHHRYQGHDGIDTDVPTRFEGVLFTNVLSKTIFCINQILFYALRPMMVRQQIFTSWYAANWAFQLSFVFFVVRNFGWGPIKYLLLSLYLAGSLHPCAAHFIAEHYVFVEGYETYSYYGWLNKLCFNVGYHNEHHDFPNIPWTRLPKLREIAPEFYDTIPFHSSWVRVFWEFITDDRVCTRSRMKRNKGEASKIKIR